MTQHTPTTPAARPAHANIDTLIGSGVRLERLGQQHAESLFAMLSEPSLWSYIPCSPPTALSAMREYIAAAERSSIDHSQIPWAIVRQDTGQVCGTTRYSDIAPAHRQLEIGWTLLSPTVQRSFVNTACKLLLLSHAFEHMPFASGIGCERVQLKCDHRNIRSQEAILRLGASFEGRLRRHRILPDGFIRDTMMYSIVREEWPRVQDGLLKRLQR